MILTLKAGWLPYSTRRGIRIYKREARTGTCGGSWMIYGSTFNTLRSTQNYIDNLPVGHFVAPGQLVKDEL